MTNPFEGKNCASCRHAGKALLTGNMIMCEWPRKNLPAWAADVLLAGTGSLQWQPFAAAEACPCYVEMTKAELEACLTEEDKAALSKMPPSGELARQITSGEWERRKEKQVQPESEKIVELIELLALNEGASVEILCPNPDFGDGPARVIVVADEWTNWQPLRFGGNTLLAALENAWHERSLKVVK